jgi:hypothetical protein
MRIGRKKRLLDELPTTRADSWRVAVGSTVLVAVMGVLIAMGVTTDATSSARDVSSSIGERSISASSLHSKNVLDERRARFDGVPEGRDYAQRTVGSAARSWRVSAARR